MLFHRRQFLATAAAGIATGPVWAGGSKPATAMGIALDSYAVRMRTGRRTGFTDPLRFLTFCRERGLAGVQLPVGVRDAGYVKRLRAQLDESGMYLEGDIRTPRDRSDQQRFEAELASASAAGATVVRTAMLGGRRYETFKTADDYRAFKRRALRSLELAEPIASRRKMRLAIENHKDYRATELAELMRHLSSEYVGVCVDTGNNIALLDDPTETVKVLAPWAFSCHFKDMAVEDGSNGFLLAEVPLGEGFLDLNTIVQLLRRLGHAVHFNLEMITRNPLWIPCLTDGYWATLGDVPGRDLARTLRQVRRHAPSKPLPRIMALGLAEQLALEDQNVQRSVTFAQQKLHL